MADDQDKKPVRFDLNRYTNQIKDQLPPPGRHSALIENVEYSDKTETVWLFVDWKIDGFESIRQILAIEASVTDGDGPDLFRRKQLAQGLTQLLRICEVAGFDPNTEFDNFSDFQNLIGTKAEIVVGHRKAYGVPEAVVKMVLGR